MLSQASLLLTGPVRNPDVLNSHDDTEEGNPRKGSKAGDIMAEQVNEQHASQVIHRCWALHALRFEAKPAVF